MIIVIFIVVIVIIFKTIQIETTEVADDLDTGVARFIMWSRERDNTCRMKYEGLQQAREQVNRMKSKRSDLNYFFIYLYTQKKINKMQSILHIQFCIYFQKKKTGVYQNPK